MRKKEIKEQIFKKWKIIEENVCYKYKEPVSIIKRKNQEFVRCKNKASPFYRKQIFVWKGTFFTGLHSSKYRFLINVELWLVKTPKKCISYVLKVNIKTIYCALKKISKILVKIFIRMLSKL